MEELQSGENPSASRFFAEKNRKEMEPVQPTEASSKSFFPSSFRDYIFSLPSGYLSLAPLQNMDESPSVVCQGSANGEGGKDDAFLKPEDAVENIKGSFQEVKHLQKYRGRASELAGLSADPSSMPPGIKSLSDLPTLPSFKLEACPVVLRDLIQGLHTVLTSGTEEVLALRHELRGLVDDMETLLFSQSLMHGTLYPYRYMSCAPHLTLLGRAGSQKEMVLDFMLYGTCAAAAEFPGGSRSSSESIHTTPTVDSDPSRPKPSSSFPPPRRSTVANRGESPPASRLPSVETVHTVMGEHPFLANAERGESPEECGRTLYHLNSPRAVSIVAQPVVPQDTWECEGERVSLQETLAPQHCSTISQPPFRGQPTPLLFLYEENVLTIARSGPNSKPHGKDLGSTTSVGTKMPEHGRGSAGVIPSLLKDTLLKESSGVQWIVEPGFCSWERAETDPFNEKLSESSDPPNSVLGTRMSQLGTCSSFMAGPITEATVCPGVVVEEGSINQDGVGASIPQTNLCYEDKRAWYRANSRGESEDEGGTVHSLLDTRPNEMAPKPTIVVPPMSGELWDSSMESFRSASLPRSLSASSGTFANGRRTSTAPFSTEVTATHNSTFNVTTSPQKKTFTAAFPALLMVDSTLPMIHAGGLMNGCKPIPQPPLISMDPPQEVTPNSKKTMENTSEDESDITERGEASTVLPHFYANSSAASQGEGPRKLWSSERHSLPSQKHHFSFRGSLPLPPVSKRIYTILPSVLRISALEWATECERVLKRQEPDWDVGTMKSLIESTSRGGQLMNAPQSPVGRAGQGESACGVGFLAEGSRNEKSLSGVNRNMTRSRASGKFSARASPCTSFPFFASTLECQLRSSHQLSQVDWAHDCVCGSPMFEPPSSDLDHQRLDGAGDPLPPHEKPWVINTGTDAAVTPVGEQSGWLPQQVEGDVLMLCIDVEELNEFFAVEEPPSMRPIASPSLLSSRDSGLASFLPPRPVRPHQSSLAASLSLLFNVDAPSPPLLSHSASSAEPSERLSRWGTSTEEVERDARSAHLHRSDSFKKEVEPWRGDNGAAPKRRRSSVSIWTSPASSSLEDGNKGPVGRERRTSQVRLLVNSQDLTGWSSGNACSAYKEQVQQSLAHQSIFVLTYRDESDLVKASEVETPSSSFSQTNLLSRRRDAVVQRFIKAILDLFNITIHAWQVVLFSPLQSQAASDLLTLYHKDVAPEELLAPRSRGSRLVNGEGSHMGPSSRSAYQRPNVSTLVSATAMEVPNGPWGGLPHEPMPARTYSRSNSVGEASIRSGFWSPSGTLNGGAPTSRLLCQPLSVAVQHYFKVLASSGLYPMVSISGQAVEAEKGESAGKEALANQAYHHAKTCLWYQSGAEKLVSMARRVQAHSATFVLSHTASSLVLWASRLLPLLPLALQKTEVLISEHRRTLSWIEAKKASLEICVRGLQANSREMSLDEYVLGLQQSFQEHTENFLRDIRGFFSRGVAPQYISASGSPAVASAFTRLEARYKKFSALTAEKNILHEMDHLRSEIEREKLEHAIKVQAYLASGSSPDHTHSPRVLLSLSESEPLLPREPPSLLATFKPTSPLKDTTVLHSASALEKEEDIVKLRGSFDSIRPLEVEKGAMVETMKEKELNHEALSSSPPHTKALISPSGALGNSRREKHQVSQIIDPDFPTRVQMLRDQRRRLEVSLLQSITLLLTEAINLFAATVVDHIPALRHSMQQTTSKAFGCLRKTEMFVDEVWKSLPGHPPVQGVHANEESCLNILSSVPTGQSGASVGTDTGPLEVNAGLASDPPVAREKENVLREGFVHLWDTLQSVLHAPKNASFVDFAGTFRAAMCEDVVRSLARVQKFKRSTESMSIMSPKLKKEVGGDHSSFTVARDDALSHSHLTSAIVKAIFYPEEEELGSGMDQCPMHCENTLVPTMPRNDPATSHPSRGSNASAAAETSGFTFTPSALGGLSTPSFPPSSDHRMPSLRQTYELACRTRGVLHAWLTQLPKAPTVSPHACPPPVSPSFGENGQCSSPRYGESVAPSNPPQRCRSPTPCAGRESPSGLSSRRQCEKEAHLARLARWRCEMQALGLVLPFNFMEQPASHVLLDVVEEAFLLSPFQPWLQLEAQPIKERVQGVSNVLQLRVTKTVETLSLIQEEWKAGLAVLEKEAHRLSGSPSMVRTEVRRILNEALRVGKELDAFRSGQAAAQ